MSRRPPLQRPRVVSCFLSLLKVPLMFDALQTEMLPEEDDAAEIPRYFLSQGEIVCSQEPAVISTVLGSCVALCLYDPRRRIGAMNHYVLPSTKSEDKNLRYGNVAIPALIDAMTKRGSKLSDLQAKFFGGAAGAEGTATRIAASNAEIAAQTLKNLGIPVTAQSTGGRKGCVIYMHTFSGEVLVRRLTQH